MSILPGNGPINLKQSEISQKTVFVKDIADWARNIKTFHRISIKDYADENFQRNLFSMFGGPAIFPFKVLYIGDEESKIFYL